MSTEADRSEVLRLARWAARGFGVSQEKVEAYALSDFERKAAHGFVRVLRRGRAVLPEVLCESTRG